MNLLVLSYPNQKSLENKVHSISTSISISISISYLHISTSNPFHFSHPPLFCHDMKTKAFFSSYQAALLASFLSCAFLLFFIWQHDFASSLHLPTTLTPASGLNRHDNAGDRHPVRPPSVEYIDLAANHQFSSRPYDIYPDYKARGRWQRLHGSRRPCVGPRGVNVNDNPGDMIEAWSLAGSDGRCRHLVRCLSE